MKELTPEQIEKMKAGNKKFMKRWAIPITIIVGIIVVIVFLNEPSQPLIRYSFIENKVTDIPSKSQVLKRIVLIDSSFTSDDINSILQYEYKKSMDISMKFHNPPSHIFIYIYKTQEILLKDGNDWIGKFSRIMDKNENIMVIINGGHKEYPIE